MAVPALASVIGRKRPPLLAYEQVIEAVGHGGNMGQYGDEVRLDSIIGSVSKSEEFDAEFRPRRRAGRERIANLAAHVDAHGMLPAVELFRVGDLHFVIDGHHRVALARERNWVSIPAKVKRVCAIAYARCCLTAESLATKAAERRFLERLPLPDEVRRENWLDSPADWSRLADAAMSWGWQRQTQDGASAAYCCAADLAAAWWTEEVRPVVERFRDREADDTLDLSDLQVFVGALARRDRLGELDWADERNAEVRCI